jgi:hypothetical protein
LTGKDYPQGQATKTVGLNTILHPEPGLRKTITYIDTAGAGEAT